jgi:type II secretory pathway predicted ATPase ExeA
LSQHPYTEFPPDIRVKSTHLQPFISTCYKPALQQLGQAYTDRRPAAILVGDGQVGPRLVVESFLRTLDDDVTVVRIEGPCPDASTCMRQIVSDVGFEPEKMSLGDLESVVEMFLVYQRSKKRRTVISFENSDASDWWVRDKIRQLIELEAQEKFGLLVVQSGIANQDQDLDDPLIDLNGSGDILRITLSPLRLSETRDFVRKYVEGRGAGKIYVDDVGQVFEFFAVTLIHNFSGGVPEVVEKLSGKCLRLMRDSGDPCVSTDTVRIAARILGLEIASPDTDPEAPTNGSAEEATRPGRLIVQAKGEPDQFFSLDQKCILIGRDLLCGISINGLRVSRYHGFFALAENGLQFVDLGSTNGSYVNGTKSQRSTLKHNDIVAIGHARIRYIAGGEQLTMVESPDRTDSMKVVLDQPVEPSITNLGDDLHLFRS